MDDAADAETPEETQTQEEARWVDFTEELYTSLSEAESDDDRWRYITDKYIYIEI
jgi:hypothetical protein